MEDILKKLKKKAILVVKSIITKDQSVFNDNKHEWLDINANISSMNKFERLKHDLCMKET